MDSSNSLSPLDRFRNLSSQMSIPLQASLELTYRCNERCTHCYLETFHDDKARSLSLEEWKHVIRELRGAGSLYLILMGGEAMLHPHFFEIAAFARDLHFHISIITNGLRIKSLEMAKKMREHGIVNATISLYSLDPKIHDQMTKVRGSHALTLKAIEFCQQANIQVGINCLLTRDNIESYFDLADFCIERNLEIKSDPNVTPKMDGDMAPTQLRASTSQLVNYYKEVARRWPAGKPKAQSLNPKENICNAARGKCAVNPYGDLLVCLEVRESLGNLKTESFSKLWNNAIANKWRHLTNEQLLEKNKQDKSVASFCEHCPGIACHENKDPLKMTNYSLEVAKAKKLVAQNQEQLS